MLNARPNLIIGFHGCEASVRDKLLQHPETIQISQKPYDWLGKGMYFWENNYERALQWALEKKSRGALDQPAVIGAVLHLGHCCDFLDSKYIRLLSEAFANMDAEYKKAGIPIPTNKDLPQDQYKDKIMRHRDCAVIEYLHLKVFDILQEELKSQGHSSLKPFDSTRGVFTEGGPAFEGAGLFAKSHIQICVRNPNCIQGFFLPKEEIDFQSWLQQNTYQNKRA